MKRNRQVVPLVRQICLSITVVLAFLSISVSLAHAQLEQIETRIPKNVPIKVEFKNYESTNWVHNLEIIVTNSGKKPIHFLFLSLTLDVKSENGNVRGFAL